MTARTLTLTLTPGQYDALSIAASEGADSPDMASARDALEQAWAGADLGRRAHIRRNIQGDVLGVITGHGGQVIVSSPEMSAMTGELVDVVIAWLFGDRLAEVIRFG